MNVTRTLMGVVLLSCAWNAATAQEPGAIAARFNDIYKNRPQLFQQEPSTLLKRAVANAKAGRALDVGMGQGRNALYLANLGWDVTGYDLSEEGLRMAQAEADRRGVKLRTVAASHSTFDFGREQWDLIVMAYALTDMSDAAFLEKIRGSLRPGGMVVVEQMNSPGTGAGPANALFRSFENMRVLFYEDVVDKAEWGLRPMRLGRLIAVRE